MARGRKPKPKTLPKPPADENAKYRTVVYHLCGGEIYAQPIRDRASAIYHFAFYATRRPKDDQPLQVCPHCHTRVSRQSIRLPAEQLRYEMAEESLAIQLANSREEESEEPETPDAETPPSP